MFLEIVTPDEKVYEGEVESATFPGSDGSFQVLSNHASMISTLGTGDIKFVREVNKKPEETHIQVSGGVVEVLNNKVTVLAEKVINE
ncbi:ATP synthase F1 subunit epsilon [Marinoscillum furvescens]|uniref:ATP synthase F1 subcomplex epsilon subunit n=1 Tax=Marinoscillum furvescens DSM 4134 TaxID=1122208 RepID=A0A3D9LJZ6_MARFU|nr:ATP synthase F1 subunit epsilon [Marinoscillum furvescens]REE05966.1 ATP synthase F1 subcomplex epsilon subunit [Marinoscillum furvescens DSM 4134]